MNLIELNKEFTKSFSDVQWHMINKESKITNDVTVEGMLGIFRGIGAELRV